MKTKVIALFAVLLIPAFYFAVSRNNKDLLPSDLRDAPNSLEAIDQLTQSTNDVPAGVKSKVETPVAPEGEAAVSWADYNNAPSQSDVIVSKIFSVKELAEHAMNQAVKKAKNEMNEIVSARLLRAQEGGFFFVILLDPPPTVVVYAKETQSCIWARRSEEGFEKARNKAEDGCRSLGGKPGQLTRGKSDSHGFGSPFCRYIYPVSLTCIMSRNAVK